MQIGDKLFRSIFFDSSLGMMLFEPDGKILKVNKETAQIFRKTEKSIEQVYINTLICEEDKKPFLAALGNFLKGQRDKLTIDVRFYKAEGQLGWCRFNISGIDSMGPPPVFLLALVEDITNQKILENQLKRAKMVAEKATRTKSEFLANMSHEIRTPIHTIIGMSELIKDTNLDAEQKEYAGQVEFSAEVLLSLINDILDVEKIEAGKLKLETIEMDVLEVAYSAVDLIALEAHNKNLEVALYIEPDVVHLVYGDPTRLRQILVNLFNNAIKFTSRGEIGLKISTVKETDDEVCLLFRVRDTGIGIPREKMDKLFKEFSQVDSSTTRKYGGTGLGLTISKNLSKLMNGEIGVESTEGSGSIFWFTALFQKQDKESPYVCYREIYHDKHVLIVDDNATAREILSLYLGELGFQVTESDNGQDALEILKKSTCAEVPFSLCVVDQIMPGMDGWHFASEINALKNQPGYAALRDLKLYLVSPAGRSAEEAKMKLLNWFEGYLNKPLKKHQLYSVLAGMNTDDENEEPLELLPVDDGPVPVRIKAMVAEDHEVNQQLFRSILENLGCDVVLASNGKEAVEQCKASKPDLIFMDCQMPEMNGYEATEAIRLNGYQMPVIAVTASAIKGEREKCISSGMSDFLTKPFKKKDIQPFLLKWRNRNHDGSPVIKDQNQSSGAEEMVEPEIAGCESEDFRDKGNIFNYNEAVETFLGNEGTVRKLIKSYIEKVEGQIPQIENSLADGDTDSSRGIAHSIKGSALNLSMEILGKAAKTLEYSSRDGDLEASKKNLEVVKSAFEDLKKYVESNKIIRDNP